MPKIFGWGGLCKCPSGKSYPAVGVIMKFCKTILCFGGELETCNKFPGEWWDKEVHCGVNFQFYIQIFYLLLNRNVNSLNFGWMKIQIKI